jgi:hypothetical protein
VVEEEVWDEDLLVQHAPSQSLSRRRLDLGLYVSKHLKSEVYSLRLSSARRVIGLEELCTCSSMESDRLSLADTLLERVRFETPLVVSWTPPTH